MLLTFSTMNRMKLTKLDFKKYDGGIEQIFGIESPECLNSMSNIKAA